MTAWTGLCDSLFRAAPVEPQNFPTARLVERARARDGAAERALYDRHARAILRFALDLVGDPADAGDVVQETFARAFRTLSMLANPDRYVAWLYGIARNVCLECLKSRRRWRRLQDAAEHVKLDFDAAANPECDLLSRELARRLSCALAGLSTNRRSVLLLRCDHGLAYHDIASIMGWSLAKAKVEVHRARLELRSALASKENAK